MPARTAGLTAHRLRLAARAARITMVAAGVGLRIMASRLRGRRDPAPGEIVADALERLGPTFVKAGQILASRQDLLPPRLVVPLRRLYEDLADVPAGTFERAFREEFRTGPAGAFATWDDRPMASASVASVYRAWLPDGTPVAVKVLRPGIGGTVDADLRLLRGGARLVGRLPGARYLPAYAMVDELAGCLSRQLDLRREAASNRRLRQALDAEGGIVVPEPVDLWCGDTVLTMQLIEGVPLDRHCGAAPLEAVLRALYRMIFVEGLVHCDLHPGNLRVLPDGRVAVLDFGFMAEMPTRARLDFTRFFYAMANGDGPACARIAVQTASAVRPGLDYPAFEREMEVIVDRVAGVTASRFQVAGFVASLFDLMRRHGIRGTTSFTMAIVSLVVIEGLAKEAGVDLAFQEEARPYLLRASLRGALVEAGPTDAAAALRRAGARR